MNKVGVIGLGNMGIGMAKNLLQNGYHVWGCDIDAQRMEALFKMLQG